MLAKLRLSPADNRLSVLLDGDLDLTAYRHFKTVAELGRASGCQCVLDFAHVDRVFDSGLSVLMLLRSDLGEDDRFRLINCSPSIQRELQRVGIRPD
jgi:anti-anti-sigma regulatory factor